MQRATIDALLGGPAGADTTAPTVTVTSPVASSVLVTNTPSVNLQVSGTATDDARIVAAPRRYSRRSPVEYGLSECNRGETQLPTRLRILPSGSLNQATFM